MTNGYQFSVDPARTAILRPELATNESSIYFVPSLKCCCSVDAFIAPIMHDPNLFGNFAEFQRWLGSYYIVENTRGWFACTCHVSLTENICKHSVGIRIAYHGLEVPYAAKALPLGQRRGPGRPPNVGPAIQFD